MVQGGLEVAERFMTRWHKDEAKLSKKRHGSAMDGVDGNGGARGKSSREASLVRKQEGDGRHGSKVPGR